PVVERKAVSFAGMAGEMTKVEDRLKDYETGKKKDWYRLRALLVAPDGATWYHATAMASGDDLAMIETDFARLLGSIRIKAAGEADTNALLQQLSRRMEEERARREEQDEAEKAARATAPVEDVETRFDKAMASI